MESQLYLIQRDRSSGEMTSDLNKGDWVEIISPLSQDKGVGQLRCVTHNEYNKIHLNHPILGTQVITELDRSCLRLWLTKKEFDALTK